MDFKPHSTWASVSSQKRDKDIQYLSDLFRNQNSSLSRSCLSVEIESYSQFKATKPTTEAVGTDTTKIEIGHPGISGYSVFSENTTFTYFTPYKSTFSPPCCGVCMMDADDAHVMYWLTPAPQPHVSTIVDADGFTL